ncbi:hypothetical protein ACFXCZ_27280 [Streptomyces sp. NPDC059396]|uniref:hypothetical protein n=1 Tax=Streptomyces sp. NPDC059396 TaxID=3346819 RepID=UPI0036C3A17D
MTTPTIVTAAAAPADHPDDLTHIYCPCSDTVAYCGVDLTGAPETGDLDAFLCVVCDDLADGPCRRCGRTW